VTVDEELRDGLGLCADVCPKVAIAAPCPLRRGAVHTG